MKLNKTAVTSNRTHNGGPASMINPEQQLRRLLMCHLLWEDTFYVEGENSAEALAAAVHKVDAEVAASIAIEARTQFHMRHAPLLVAREMARNNKQKHLVGNLLPQIIQRADELTEFLALYWKEKKQPLSAQVKKGLQRAMLNFDQYQYAKYNRDSVVRFRDLLRLVHTKPNTPEQEAIFGTLARGEKLDPPNTWEVRLSSGEEPKKVFEDLMQSKKLGAMAFLRNLRKMEQSKVDRAIIREYAKTVNVDRILPFRFIAAALAAPTFRNILEPMMLRAAQSLEKLPGHTTLLVDTSGSMQWAISNKSDINRLQAASALAILLAEICEDFTLYTFTTNLSGPHPSNRGFALSDFLHKVPSDGTSLGKSLKQLNATQKWDRLIVLTDEQSSDPVGNYPGKNYMINVASYINGVGYGDWTKVDGWSEQVVRFIQNIESV